MNTHPIDYRPLVDALSHIPDAALHEILNCIEDANPYTRACACCSLEELPLNAQREEIPEEVYYEGERGEHGWLPVHLEACPVGILCTSRQWRCKLVKEEE